MEGLCFARPHFAGFWKRLVAHLVDSIILHLGSIVCLLIILGAVFWAQFLRNSGTPVSFYDFFDAFSLQILILAIRAVLFLGYYTWLTYRFGTTVGKKMLGIYVVSQNDLSPIQFKQSLMRTLGYILSAIPFGVGYLMAAFHPKKQAFHDWLAGTVCIFKQR